MEAPPRKNACQVCSVYEATIFVTCGKLKLELCHSHTEWVRKCLKVEYKRSLEELAQRRAKEAEE